MLLDYCRRSANPVGRLVLYLSRIQDPESQRLSDHICTGLQLANFCQDVANDWDRGRVYLPQSTLREVGYTDAHFCRREYNAAFRKALQIEVDRAERQLQAGKPLVERIPRELQFDVSLFIAGGLAILNAIRRQDYNVWTSRPALSKSQKLAIAAREWLRSQFEPRRKPAFARSSATSRSELAESYTHCRQLARRSASNFAWAFCLLPARKRQAMYALYAFLRRTDDLGDNPSPVEERRMDLHAWRNSLERALDGTYDDPILPALANTVHHFAIPAEHLHAVIDGVLFDCDHYDSDQPRFATFLQLECYCERVASAVGMACIHIWGFKDRAAYEPARQCGIAFQLTNILRDLRQDAAEGRIYLPQEDFSCTGYAPADLRNGVANTRFLSLIDLEVERALASYRVAEELIPLLDPSARRIYRTMLNTYRSLLDRICEDPAVILRQRVGLSRWRKLRIVGRSWFASNKPPAAVSTARCAPSTLV
jgi:phytoene synthase